MATPSPAGNRSAIEASGPLPGPAGLAGSRLGDFQIERLLGRGGMGDVYLARQLSLGRPVAVKVLKPAFAADPAAMARFESEAWTAARLNHPHIVHVYHLGQEGQVRFIAMEYVPGITLRMYIERQGPPPVGIALKLMDQATQALAAAAHSGLVHRDIKPENLLLTADLDVKVADFGLCRESDPDRAGLTEPGVTLGTPLYMSPEQVLGRPLDQRSDLYSLGATYYHLLAGVPPFEAGTTMALAYKHTSEIPTSLAVHRPDLPPDLIGLVMRLLEKAPEDRHATASEVLSEVRRIRSRIEGQTEIARTGPAPSIRKRRGPKLLACALPLALLGGLTVGLLTRWKAAPPASPLAPGLWMLPWETIPEKSTAQSQYRFAQTGLNAERRSAGWLAVVGRFPGSAFEEAAYVQLIRELARHGDVWRLDRLAEEFVRRNATDRREFWLALSRLARAGAAASRRDVQGVLDPFREWANLELIDPSHAEVGLELIAQIRRSSTVPGIQAGALNKLATELLVPLQIPANNRPFLDPPRSPDGG
jgi:serine/threonine-protein kinase